MKGAGEGKGKVGMRERVKSVDDGRRASAFMGYGAIEEGAKEGNSEK